GKTYDMAAEAALADVARTGATLVPPYDDLRTMAGQGTIAVEILQQLGSEPDLVVVPVGGGGCISGITTYLA
ncbi:threonine dehydratase, partial [Mycobacterium sp. ITM-2017-0098]